MLARRSVWSDEKVKALAAEFVPAADEVWYLQHRDDPACRFFRGFCEEGHYGGRTKPTDTRQGIYCCTPGGKFLASINSTRAPAVAAMLEQALARWRALPERERVPPAAPVIRPPGSDYPEDGLVLRVYTRDLPREGGAGRGGWLAQAWNQDFAWFTRDEARSLLPPEPAAGAKHAVAPEIARRLARLHLVDCVSGQTLPYRPGEVKTARLETQVVGLEGTVATIEITGETATEAKGEWARSMRMRLRGRAMFDLKAGRFTAFAMVAIGTRTGRTRYNNRDGDPGPAPIGVAFVLAGDTPQDRIRPSLR